MHFKRIIYIVVSLIFSVCFLQAQVPSDISRIIKKMQSGTTITEAEQKALENYSQSMQKKYGNRSTTSPSGSTTKQLPGKSNSKAKLPSNISPLTRESYIKLATSLMQQNGIKTGNLSKLNELLSKTENSTEGADYGALFMMEGAQEASIYTCAWSAVKNPADILTANNLAVALKNTGELAKALQVLNYANAIKPNIGLIVANIGWVYYESEVYEKAKSAFNNALKVSSEMTSPYLGLGLIAQKEGNNIKAKEYLAKALRKKYSLAGRKAYQKAQENSTSDSQSTNDPLSGEKETSSNLNVPEIPVYEQPQKMAPQQSILQNYVTGISTRLDQIIAKIETLSDRIKTQQEYARQHPDNAIVYNRDFSKEIMLLDDIDLLLWGEPSNFGKAVRASSAHIANAQKLMEQNSGTMLPYQERYLQLLEIINRLAKKMLACNGNKACEAKVAKEMEPFITEEKQIEYKLCKLGKQQMDILLSGGYKSLSTLQSEFKTTVPDYYAFTNPILEKIYAPALNELYNLKREARILSEEKALASQALGLADNASKYYEFKCIEPEPPGSPDAEIEDSDTPKKKPDNCPLGDGLKGGFGAFAFELTCTYVKISGGEGVLTSVKRDFLKHETTVWAGVGAKAEYGHGNITGEATVGVEVTLGQNSVTDVGLTSSVKAGIGGLTETEISGRIALEGGASIDMDTNFLP
jgi:tetratricopeptide (TPR) repeat protein